MFMYFFPGTYVRGYSGRFWALISSSEDFYSFFCGMEGGLSFTGVFPVAVASKLLDLNDHHL